LPETEKDGGKTEEKARLLTDFHSTSRNATDILKNGHASTASSENRNASVFAQTEISDTENFTAFLLADNF